MNFEEPKFEQVGPKVEVESEYEGFIPDDFKNDPFGYFEREGKNIKPGEVKYDESGRIREDPTAVKELPIWMDDKNNEIRVIGKRVNVEKGEVGKSGDPFYEYRILQIVHELDLPAPHPVAKVESGSQHLIVMGKVAGINWYEKEILRLRERGYSDEDIEGLRRQAEEKMLELKRRFDDVGIIRGWKLKDMVFDIDVDNKVIRGIVPVDWERTRIDSVKLEEAKKKKGLS